MWLRRRRRISEKGERKEEERREEEGAGNAYIQSFVKTGHTHLCISKERKAL